MNFQNFSFSNGQNTHQQPQQQPQWQSTGQYGSMTPNTPSVTFSQTYPPSQSPQMGDKERELLNILDNIEKSYDPCSPAYKFSYVFYNIVDRPFERPPHFDPQLWNSVLTPDPTLMPVILNKEQINERKRQQNDLIVKINESKGAVTKKVESLVQQREMLHSRIGLLVAKYRRICRQYVEGEPNPDVHKLSPEVPDRPRYRVPTRRKEELCRHLAEMKNQLADLDNRVTERLRGWSTKNISEHGLLDKM